MGINKKSLDIDNSSTKIAEILSGSKSQQPLYYYNFANEEYLWQSLSFPLLNYHVPVENHLSVEENYLSSRVQTTPVTFLGQCTRRMGRSV